MTFPYSWRQGLASFNKCNVIRPRFNQPTTKSCSSQKCTEVKLKRIKYSVHLLDRHWFIKYVTVTIYKRSPFITLNTYVSFYEVFSCLMLQSKQCCQKCLFRLVARLMNIVSMTCNVKTFKSAGTHLQQTIMLKREFARRCC